MEQPRSFIIFLLDCSASALLVNEIDRPPLPVFTYRGERDVLPEMFSLLFTSWSITAQPIHNTLVEDDRESASYGYYVGTVRYRGPACRLVWQTIPTILARPDLPPAQQRALRTCLDRLAHPVEMFDERHVAAEFDAWAVESLQTKARPVTGRRAAIRHNRARRLIVWKAPLVPDVYAKGHAKGAREAALTQQLVESCPDLFAKTLALDAKRGWWLYEGVAGHPTQVGDLTPTAAALLGRTIASMQQRTMKNERLRAAVGVTASNAELIDFYALIKAMKHHGLTSGTIPSCCGDSAAWLTIDEALGSIDGMPDGFIQSDFGLANITYDGDAFRFIDNEISCWGPVVLTLASLACRLQTIVATEVAREIVLAYLDEWCGVPAVARCHIGLKHLVILDHLLKLKRSLDRAGLSAQGCLADYRARRRNWPSGKAVADLVRATGHRCPDCARLAANFRPVV